MNILTAPAALDLSSSGILAVLGYSVVFFGLILLMIVVTLIGTIFKHREMKAAAVIVPENPSPVQQPEAPGAAGQLKLHDVEPKTAAMLMAIVADKLEKPLNELRFISIKEVK